MNDRAQTPVGWIGLGQMGHRMARNLAAGFPLVVADADPTAPVPDGATVAAANRDVGTAVETVFLSLPDGPICRAVCRDLVSAPDRKLRTVVDTSTIGIAAARAIAADLEALGVAYVDAPVSGGTAGAAQATLSVIIGCPAAKLVRLRPMLSLIGKNLFRVGDRPGDGQAVKLLNNFLSATAMTATSEAIHFGTSIGLDMQVILDVVNASTGQNTATLDKFPNRILPGRYDAGFATAMMAKDLRLYLENVREAGSADSIGATVAGLWQEMHAAMPDSDFTRIYPFTKERKGR